MATFVYATFEDVSESYENGPLSEDVRIRIERLITRASAKLTSLVPGLPNRLANGEVEQPGADHGALRPRRDDAGDVVDEVGGLEQLVPLAVGLHHRVLDAV